jgi:hypothetical protein
MRVPSDQEIWQDAIEILLAQMSPSRAIRMLSALQVGHGDYAQVRDELFKDKSVSEIAKQIRRYERQKRRT